MRTITIDRHTIGPGGRCFIIAEAGVNHNGDPELARRLIDAAAEAGADAVKFQTFKTEKIATTHAPKADYQKENTGEGGSQVEMIRKLELSSDIFADLKGYCERLGILFLSTPFDEESTDFLDELGMAAFKVASGEITNLPLLGHIALKGKPIILSTGMSDLSEVQDAVWTLREAGNEDIILLHCVSTYPADPADINLRAMGTMASTFEVPVGYSDHTLGLTVSLAASAIGACVIEKHFTLDRTLPGPDQRASLEPGELRELVQSVRTVEAVMGSGIKRPAASEMNTLMAARKSLVASRLIPAGEVLTEEMIAIKRPGTGLPPGMRSEVVGRTAKESIEEDELLSLEMLI